MLLQMEKANTSLYQNAMTGKTHYIFNLRNHILILFQMYPSIQNASKGVFKD